MSSYKGKCYLIMNELENMEQEFFICQCNNVEHQMIFRYFKDDNFGDVYVTIHLVPDSFWKRIKNAFKYIFGYKSKYGDFDEFILKPTDADRLQEIVNYLRQ